MERFSKPLGNLLDFKQGFFAENDSRLAKAKATADLYRSQPARVQCKNCTRTLDFSHGFTKLGVQYALCSQCGHCNGAHEDTAEFCFELYAKDAGQEYAGYYTADDRAQFQQRTASIYRPKAEFLREALGELGHFPARICDFGAGAGYFVSAAQDCGFRDVMGYEASETLAGMGNHMLGEEIIQLHTLDDILTVMADCDREVASMIGVLEHLQTPREAFATLAANPNVRFIFFSVPLFSPTVILESVFSDIMPRHLVAGHTHLYTDQSLEHLCTEFGFTRRASWWFGLDMTDLYRSVRVQLERQGDSRALIDYWTEHFLPVVDRLQAVLDESKTCSEVHLLVEKVAP